MLVVKSVDALLYGRQNAAPTVKTANYQDFVGAAFCRPSVSTLFETITFLIETPLSPRNSGVLLNDTHKLPPVPAAVLSEAVSGRGKQFGGAQPGGVLRTP